MKKLWQQWKHIGFNWTSENDTGFWQKPLKGIWLASQVWAQSRPAGLSTTRPVLFCCSPRGCPDREHSDRPMCSYCYNPLCSVCLQTSLKTHGCMTECYIFCLLAPVVTNPQQTHNSVLFTCEWDPQILADSTVGPPGRWYLNCEEEDWLCHMLQHIVFYEHKLAKKEMGNTSLKNKRLKVGDNRQITVLCHCLTWIWDCCWFGVQRLSNWLHKCYIPHLIASNLVYMFVCKWREGELL